MTDRTTQAAIMLAFVARIRNDTLYAAFLNWHFDWLIQPVEASTVNEWPWCRGDDADNNDIARIHAHSRKMIRHSIRNVLCIRSAEACRPPTGVFFFFTHSIFHRFCFFFGLVAAHPDQQSNGVHDPITSTQLIIFTKICIERERWYIYRCI